MGIIVLIILLQLCGLATTALVEVLYKPIIIMIQKCKNVFVVFEVVTSGV